MLDSFTISCRLQRLPTTSNNFQHIYFVFNNPARKKARNSRDKTRPDPHFLRGHQCQSKCTLSMIPKIPARLSKTNPRLLRHLTSRNDDTNKKKRPSPSLSFPLCTLMTVSDIYLFVNSCGIAAISLHFLIH